MPQAKQRGQYPSDWEALSKMVKREAGNRCVRCGHLHEPKVGRTLTVHHFDGNRSNNERWNLMALCQACHLSVQARVDPSQGLMHDPAVWAMPYVAGMVEAYATPAPPRYDEAAWKASYAITVGKPWPHWAPQIFCPF